MEDGLCVTLLMNTPNPGLKSPTILSFFTEMTVTEQTATTSKYVGSLDIQQILYFQGNIDKGSFE